MTSSRANIFHVMNVPCQRLPLGALQHVLCLSGMSCSNVSMIK